MELIIQSNANRAGGRMELFYTERHRSDGHVYRHSPQTIEIAAGYAKYTMSHGIGPIVGSNWKPGAHDIVLSDAAGVQRVGHRVTVTP